MHHHSREPTIIFFRRLATTHHRLLLLQKIHSNPSSSSSDHKNNTWKEMKLVLGKGATAVGTATYLGDFVSAECELLPVVDVYGFQSRELIHEWFQNWRWRQVLAHGLTKLCSSKLLPPCEFPRECCADQQKTHEKPHRRTAAAARTWLQSFTTVTMHHDSPLPDVRDSPNSSSLDGSASCCSCSWVPLRLNVISPAQKAHHCHESSHQQCGEQHEQGFHLALHRASKQVHSKNSEQTKEWRERHKERQRQRSASWVVVFFFSKKQTLAKTTYLLLCYAHTQFLNPGRRDLQELLPTNSELSETIWARAILYWIFIFLQLHSFTTIHGTWSDPPPNNITHLHSTIISHNNNFVPAACLPQLSGRWLGFVECLRILRPKIWTTSATKKLAKFSQYSRLLEKKIHEIVDSNNQLHMKLFTRPDCSKLLTHYYWIQHHLQTNNFFQEFRIEWLFYCLLTSWGTLKEFIRCKKPQIASFLLTHFPNATSARSQFNKAQINAQFF